MEGPIVAGVLETKLCQLLSGLADRPQPPPAQAQKQLRPGQLVAGLLAGGQHSRQQRYCQFKAFLLIGPVAQAIGRCHRQLGSQGLHQIEAQPFQQLPMLRGFCQGLQLAELQAPHRFGFATANWIEAMLNWADGAWPDSARGLRSGRVGLLGALRGSRALGG